MEMAVIECHNPFKTQMGVKFDERKVYRAKIGK